MSFEIRGGLAMNMKKVEKEYYQAKLTYFAGIAAIAAALLLLVLGIINYSRNAGNIVHLNNIIESQDKNKVRKPAYVDIYGAYPFASDDSKDYYIAYDSDFYYIISMNDDGYAYAVEEANKSDDLFRLYGWTMAIPEEARSYAINALNEDLGQTYASLADFDHIFGDVCLSVQREKKLHGLNAFFNYSLGYVISFLFTGLIGAIVFFIGKSRKKSFEPIMATSDNEFTRELDSDSTISYDKLKTYLTNHYLISLNGDFNAVSYSDIFWAYVTKHRTNGIPDYDFLNVVTKDGRMINFANGRSFGKKNKESTMELHAAIIDKIIEKNPAALIGFTAENQDAYVKLRDELKEKKKNNTIL